MSGIITFNYIINVLRLDIWLLLMLLLLLNLK